MKKLFLIFLIILFTKPILAQFNFGIKGGETYSTESWVYSAYFANSLSIQQKKALNLGIFAEFSGDKYLSVVAEVNYRQQGAQISMNYTGRDTSGTVVVVKNVDHKLAYLNVSLLGKLRYDLPYFTPYILAGLKDDIQLSNKLDDEDFGSFVTSGSASQVWGAVIGIGIEYSKGLPFSILGEFRYEFDFNQVYAYDQIANTQNYFQLKSQLFEFRIGIKF